LFEHLGEHLHLHVTSSNSYFSGHLEGKGIYEIS